MRRYQPPTWSGRAACAGMEAARFFPEDEQRGFGVERAKLVCFRCRFRPECLAEGNTPLPSLRVDSKTRHVELVLRSVPGGRLGIWGGLTHAERERISDPDEAEALCEQQAAAFGFRFVRAGGRAA